MNVLAGSFACFLAACGEEGGTGGSAQAAPAKTVAATEAAVGMPGTPGGPPLGKYDCRQYMTTINWIDLGRGEYAVGKVRGSYSYDPTTKAISWQDGAYRGWPAKYRFSPAGAGHAHDEHIIEITDEASSLKMTCYLLSD